MLSEDAPDLSCIFHFLHFPEEISLYPTVFGLVHGFTVWLQDVLK